MGPVCVGLPAFSPGTCWGLLGAPTPSPREGAPCRCPDSVCGDASLLLLVLVSPGPGARQRTGRRRSPVAAAPLWLQIVALFILCVLFLTF